MGKEISLDMNIGTDSTFEFEYDPVQGSVQDRTKPICAMGWAIYNKLNTEKFRENYVKAAQAIRVTDGYECVEEINDKSGQKTRNLLFAVTLGLMGYTIHGYKQASKTLKNIKKRLKKINKGS